MFVFVHHLRVAARTLSRTPRFTAAATLTLALGIGLSTAVFTVAEALLLRNLPVRDQDRLVLLWGETRDGRFSNMPLPLDDIRELERRSQSLLQVAFFAFRGATPTPARARCRTAESVHRRSSTAGTRLRTRTATRARQEARSDSRRGHGGAVRTVQDRRRQHCFAEWPRAPRHSRVLCGPPNRAPSRACELLVRSAYSCPSTVKPSRSAASA